MRGNACVSRARMEARDRPPRVSRRRHGAQEGEEREDEASAGHEMGGRARDEPTEDVPAVYPPLSAAAAASSRSRPGGVGIWGGLAQMRSKRRPATARSSRPGAPRRDHPRRCARHCPARNPPPPGSRRWRPRGTRRGRPARRPAPCPRRSRARARPRGNEGDGRREESLSWAAGLRRPRRTRSRGSGDQLAVVWRHGFPITLRK